MKRMTAKVTPPGHPFHSMGGMEGLLFVKFVTLCVIVILDFYPSAFQFLAGDIMLPFESELGLFLQFLIPLP